MHSNQKELTNTYEKKLDMLENKDFDEIEYKNKKLFKIPPELETIQIKSIDLSDNYIQIIDALPECIESLYINNNKIVILKNIPDTCSIINAEYNNINLIQTLPRSLKKISLFGNPIHNTIHDMDIDTMIWYSRFETDILPIMKDIIIDDICGIIAEYFALQVQSTNIHKCNRKCCHKRLTLEMAIEIFAKSSIKN